MEDFGGSEGHGVHGAHGDEDANGVAKGAAEKSGCVES